jgi:hypothetical protein
MIFGAVGWTRAQTTSPSYPPTSDGLSQFIKEMLEAADERDADKLVAMSESLLLPDAGKWFKRVFGDPLGTRLATAYEKDMKDFAPGLALLFLRLKNPKHLAVIVTCVETVDDPSAKMYQVFAMQAMKRPVPLYSILIRQEGSNASIGLWSFVHVDGRFRLAGKMLSIRQTGAKPEE